MKKTTILLVLATLLGGALSALTGFFAFKEYQDYRTLNLREPTVWNYNQSVRLYQGILFRGNTAYRLEALFNLANLEFIECVKERRVELLHAAIVGYKNVLREHPDYLPAKKNLEIALRLSEILGSAMKISPFPGVPKMPRDGRPDRDSERDKNDKPGIAPYEPSLP